MTDLSSSPLSFTRERTGDHRHIVKCGGISPLSAESALAEISSMISRPIHENVNRTTCSCGNVSLSRAEKFSCIEQAAIHESRATYGGQSMPCFLCVEYRIVHGLSRRSVLIDRLPRAYPESILPPAKAGKGHHSLVIMTFQLSALHPRDLGSQIEIFFV